MAIKDSGARRQFYTPDGREAGVRDIADGKGRCDLLPLIEVSNVTGDLVLHDIGVFMKTGETCYIYNAIARFVDAEFPDFPTAVLEYAVHMEEGAKKYTTQKELKREDYGWELKKELEKESSVLSVVQISSTAKECAGAATKKTYAAEIWTTLRGKEPTPELGTNSTQTVLPRQIKSGEKIPSVKNETTRQNGDPGYGNTDLLKKPLLFYTPAKTTDVPSAESLSTMLLRYTLTMTITRGGHEECFVVSATTESECWGNLLKLCKGLSNTFSIRLRKNTDCWSLERYHEGERNWEKGIPCHCYVDSGVRHLLKCRRGDTDERHDRAFLWNMFGLLWTLENRPELNDLPKYEVQGREEVDPTCTCATSAEPDSTLPLF